MQTIFVNVDAITAKRQKQARIKRFFGPLVLFVGFGGLFNAWLEQHTLFTYRAVWAVGLAIVGAGFLMEAQYIFRTNKEPKGFLTLLVQLVLCVGIIGTTALEIANKWMGGYAVNFLWIFLAPLALMLVVLMICLLVNIAPLWFSLLFSREH